jgi:hypothetical protein
VKNPMMGALTRQALCDLIARGVSDAQAGRRFGMSKSAVRRLRRRWGIVARRNSCRPPASVQDGGAQRWARGNLSEPEIAKHYDGRRYDVMQRPPECRRDG